MRNIEQGISIFDERSWMGREEGPGGGGEKKWNEAKRKIGKKIA